MTGIIFYIHDKKLSAHINQISECINSSNQNIHSYAQMIKIVINLVSNTCEEKYNSTCQLNYLQNLLLMIIVYTPEKGVSKVYKEIDKRKMRTSSINSSLAFFSCSIRTIYKRVHRAQNKCLMLMSYIPGINTSILPKKHYEDILS